MKEKPPFFNYKVRSIIKPDLVILGVEVGEEICWMFAHEGKSYSKICPRAITDSQIENMVRRTIKTITPV